MRLIDADALKEHYNVPDAEGVFSYCDTIMQVIDSQPTIEPEVLMIKSDAVKILTDEETAILEERLKRMNHNAVIEPEVRHGRWICCGTNLAYNYSYIRCSHCNHEIKKYNYSTEIFPKYCEECGYRMDGGAENGLT